MFSALILPHSLPQTLEGVLSGPKVRPEDSLRLALLFALRFEGSSKGEIDKVERILVSRGHEESDKKVWGTDRQTHTHTHTCTHSPPLHLPPSLLHLSPLPAAPGYPRTQRPLQKMLGTI